MPSSSIDQPEESQVVTVVRLVDIYETEDEILVIADFPRVPKEALSVRLDHAELVIEGVNPSSEAESPTLLVVSSRAFWVPNTGDATSVTPSSTEGRARSSHQIGGCQSSTD